MRVRAPGKVVLWGEYAVLAQAPAAVMAVNREAQVDLDPAAQRNLFRSEGFVTPAVYKADLNFCNAPTAAMAEAVCAALGYTQWPCALSLRSDTRAFFANNGHKLGLGSSAALCVATYVALCEVFQHTASPAEAIAIHRQFQGGRGSGLDVAASWQGGVIRYTDGQLQPWPWPPDLYWSVVWTGVSASTVRSVVNFEHWRRHSAQGREPQTLQALKELSTTLFASSGHASQLLTSLRAYCAALADLDRAAELQIFTPQHLQLAKLAARSGLVYKPCGGGGGDVGIACSEDPQRLAEFNAAARAEHFHPLDLEIATHGVRVG